MTHRAPEAAPPDRAPEEQAPSRDSLRGLRVLVADDERLVLTVVARMLRREHAEVFTASDTDEAERIFREGTSSIDVLLTDVVMPGRDGVALARSLRQARPDLPVVFMSGWSSYTTADHDLPGPLLGKPFTRSALERAILSALNAASTAGR